MPERARAWPDADRLSRHAILSSTEIAISPLCYIHRLFCGLHSCGPSSQIVSTTRLKAIEMRFEARDESWYLHDCRCFVALLRGVTRGLDKSWCRG